MIHKHLHKLGQRGVTLTELLLVMGLLSIFLGVMATIFTASISSQTQTEGYTATLSDGRFLMARLDYDIARASAVSTPSALGATATSLVMTINSTTYTYALSGNALQLTDGTGSANLTDGSVIVSGLSFQKVGNSGGKETIRYSFTLTSTAQPGSGSDVKTFTSTVERR